MPELNFNLLNPSAELYSGPQVKLDPQAAYDTAQAQQQSNMLSQLYAKHYDPQTGGINYNSLIGEAAQNPLTARAIPKIMEGAQSQAQSLAEIEKNKAAARKSELETQTVYNENRHKEVQRAIRDISNYANKADALNGIEKSYEAGKIDDDAYNNLMNMIRNEPIWANSQGKILQSLMTESAQHEAMLENEKAKAPKPTEIDLGGVKKLVDTNPLSKTYNQEIRSDVKTATPGQVMTNERLTSNLNRTALNLTPDQSDALTTAIADGRLDPSKVNSRNASILAGVALKNPDADFNQLIGNAAMLRNVAYQQKAQMALALPTVLTNLENSGKKLNYSDNKWVAGLEAWGKGVNQDPQLIDYMTQRNDAILSIAAVARGVGMSDFATKLENEISSPHMSPKALEAYIAAQRKSLEPRLAEYRAHSLTSGTTPPPTDNKKETETPKKYTDAELKAAMDQYLKK